jgi:hypothetical protein
MDGILTEEDDEQSDKGDGEEGFHLERLLSARYRILRHFIRFKTRGSVGR